jgi:hypothetical protein
MRKFLSSKNLLALFVFASIMPSISNAQTIVSPTSTGTSWFTADTRPDGTVSFVNGPATPPLGCGSLQMALSLPTAKAQYFNYSYIGRRLNTITALSYWSYRNGTSTNMAAQTISLNLEVDVNGLAPGGFTTLVFEPLYQAGSLAAIVPNTWQQWDAYNGGNAIWWSTQNIPGACANSCFVTWNSIVAANPNAVILGGLGFNIGSGWFGQFTGEADALTVGISGTNTTYNFEPSADADGNGVSDACEPEDHKVIVCHKGKDLSIDRHALQAHLNHGDHIGSCSMGSITKSNAVEETKILPQKLSLSNYPNPLSSRTTIQYTVPNDGKVSIKVFDLEGRELYSMVNAQKAAGTYTVELDASKLKAGVYYYRLTSIAKGREVSAIQKMMVR